MKISAQIQDLVNVLRDLIGDEDNLSNQLAVELSKLPDFEGARATSGYYVTPDGDITHDHWWLVMDDDSIFDGSGDEPIRCSQKDPRHKHYHAYGRDRNVPVEVLTFADHLKARKRAALNKSFTEMVNEGPNAYVMPDRGYDAEGVSDAELAAVERYADRLFQKVGMDVAFSRHFIDRVNDPRNRPNISVAELIRLFKQTYKKHGRRIPKLGPDAEAVLKDMATDVNMPFVLKWDRRSGMLDLLSKTVMRKKNFGTSDPVFTVEDGKVASSDAAQDGSAMPGDVTAGGMPGVPQDEFDDETRPEDMQLDWDDLLDEDTWSHVQPVRGENMPLDQLLDMLSPADQRFIQRLETEPSEQRYLNNLQGSIESGGMKIPIDLKKTPKGVHVPEGNHRIVVAKRLGMNAVPVKWEQDVNEVDHPEYMPGGEEDSGYDPTYDERSVQTNPGSPRP